MQTTIAWYVSAALLMGYGNENDCRPKLDGCTTSTKTKSHLCMVQYGWDDGGYLAYAVLQSRALPARGGIHGLVTQGTDKAILTKPDGTSVRLPSDVQLYECIDGVFRESDKKVTKDQMKAFIASEPEIYSIDALLKFAKQSQRPRK